MPGVAPITKASRHAENNGFTLRKDGLFSGEELIPVERGGPLPPLRLAYIPPELREDLGELKVAADGNCELVQPEEIKACSMSYTYSDGLNTLREMVEGAISRSYHYLGIADLAKRLIRPWT